MSLMRVDQLGLALSATCLVHCLALPVALLTAPVLAAWLGDTETTVHWTLLAVAGLVSGMAFYAGFRRHGAARAAVLGGVGLAVMGLAVTHVFGASLEAALTVAGVAIVAFAHLVNVRLRPAPTAETVDAG